MPLSHPDIVPSGNLLLDALRVTASGRELRAQLVEIPTGEVLEEPMSASRHVFFPIHSVVSTTAHMEDGAAVEVGMAGREGMSALSAAFGTRGSVHRTVVQIGNSAHSVAADEFYDAFQRDATLRTVMLAYASYTFAAAAQFAACNRLHPVEERYARWLLMAHDRVDKPEFMLTQEYSAQMLGVRRASITVIAGRLREAGLIGYDRGHIRLIVLHGLQDAACECYGIMNGELIRLLGYDIELRQRPAAERAAS
jgi:CRP-like cAMP-binding protein